MLRLGLDVGGTKISAALFDSQNKQIYYHRYVTEKKSYIRFLEQINSIITDVKKYTDNDFSIGIGLPGSICPQSGRIRNSNCLILNDQLLKEDLIKLLGQDISIANDADCFALSESLQGAGKGKKSCFAAIIGTGCGGGIVVNQALLSGPNRVAGEWGHIPLSAYDEALDGKHSTCYCGKENCNEIFLSGTGFAKRFNERFKTEFNSLQIIELVDKEVHATEYFTHYIDMLARALSVIIHIIDPDIIVLGGGMSNTQKIYDDLPAAMHKYMFGGYCRTPIKAAQLGDDSGVLGAALLLHNTIS